MLKIPQEWEMGFTPLGLHVFTCRKDILFLMVMVLSLFWVPVINFAGTRSLYNISLSLPYLVAFPSILADPA